MFVEFFFTHIPGFDYVAFLLPSPLHVFDQLSTTLLPNVVGHPQSVWRQSCPVFSTHSLPFLASAEERRSHHVLIIRIVTHEAAGYGVPKVAKLVYQDLMGQSWI